MEYTQHAFLLINKFLIIEFALIVLIVKSFDATNISSTEKCGSAVCILYHVSCIIRANQIDEQDDLIFNMSNGFRFIFPLNINQMLTNDSVTMSYVIIRLYII